MAVNRGRRWRLCCHKPKPLSRVATYKELREARTEHAHSIENHDRAIVWKIGHLLVIPVAVRLTNFGVGAAGHGCCWTGNPSYGPPRPERRRARGIRS